MTDNATPWPFYAEAYPHEIQICDADGIVRARMVVSHENELLAAIFVRAVNRDHLFEGIREALDVIIGAELHGETTGATGSTPLRVNWKDIRRARAILAETES